MESIPAWSIIFCYLASFLSYILLFTADIFEKWPSPLAQLSISQLRRNCTGVPNICDDRNKGTFIIMIYFCCKLVYARIQDILFLPPYLF